MLVVATFGSLLQRQLRRTGAILCIGGAAVLAWGAIYAPASGVMLNARLASTGAPCGAGEACVKQSQVPTAAQAFATGDCTESTHPAEDLWHFTFPNPGSFSTDVTQFTAIFSNPSLQIHADSIQGPNNKFALVYSPAGAILQWAFATGASGRTEFNLSHTCPASRTATTTTSTATDPTTTDASTGTDTSTNTHTSTSTVTDPVTSTSTTTTPVTVTSTSTATDPTTVTSTNTTTVTATSTTTVPTSVTSATTAVLANGTGTTTTPGTATIAATSTTAESGSVAPFQASNPSSSGGAGGLGALVDTPNTGGGNRAMAALSGLLLVLFGVACLGFAPRRTRSTQVEP